MEQRLLIASDLVRGSAIARLLTGLEAYLRRAYLRRAYLRRAGRRCTVAARRACDVDCGIFEMATPYPFGKGACP